MSPESGVDAQPPLEWRASRFGTLDGIVTLAAGSGALAAAVIRPRPQHAFSGGVAFDEDVRRWLRPDDVHMRYVYRDASDVGVSLAIAWPVLADALVTAWWYRESPDVAWQMGLIDAQTFAVAAAVQGVTNVIASRERPYGRNCGTDELPAESLDCEGTIHYRSFFSGHSTFSFAGAALVCIHHFENALLGAPWDALSCAGGYAVAAPTATFRVAADVHYASDVLIGALVGTLVGYGVPLIHYLGPEPSPPSASAVRWTLVPSVGGVGVLGVF